MRDLGVGTAAITGKKSAIPDPPPIRNDGRDKHGGKIARVLGMNSRSVALCHGQFERLLGQAFCRRAKWNVPILGSLLGFVLAYLL